MVAIRLTRTGAKKRPHYRVVVMDKRRARDSKTLEIVGHYNPRPTPIELNLERERIQYWLGVGAQPSDRVKRLIKFFDEHGPTLTEAKKEAMREAAAAYTPPPLEEAPEEKPDAEKPEAAAVGEETLAAEAEAAEPKTSGEGEKPAEGESAPAESEEKKADE